MKDAVGSQGWGEPDLGETCAQGKRDHDDLRQRGATGGGDVRRSGGDRLQFI